MSYFFSLEKRKTAKKCWFCWCSFRKLANFTNNSKFLIRCQYNIYFGAFCQILDFLDQYSAFINRLRIKLDWKFQKRQNIKIFSGIILKKAKKCEHLSIKAWKFGKSIIKGYIKQFYSHLAYIKMLSLYLRGSKVSGHPVEFRYCKIQQKFVANATTLPNLAQWPFWKSLVSRVQLYVIIKRGFIWVRLST